MATRTAKRRAAAKKAARTRKANAAKRRAAGKKAAKTRRKRYGKKRKTRTTKKRAGARGASAFGGGVATGAGLAIGGGLVALIGALLLLPLKKAEEEETEPIATAGALDAQSIGLDGQDVIIYANALDNGKAYEGTRLCN